VAQRNIFAVVLWMGGALLAFSATAVAVRALAPTFSVFEMLAIRNAGGVAILVGLAVARPNVRSGLYPRRMLIHLARNGVHLAGTYGWTLGVTLLPLATVFAFEFTAPIWVAVLAVLFLGEALTFGRLVAVVLGFVGVLVILRPGVASLQPASLVVLGAAFCFAVTAVLTKKLTATESTYAILLWMNVMQLVANLIGSDPGFWSKIDGAQALPLATICFGGLLSHFCLTNAYRMGDATVVVPLDFLRIPLIAVIGWQFYGERLDPFVFVGSASIITGILVSLRAEASARGRT
jgi:drug/metabolite transporter (DMT)-like permease